MIIKHSPRQKASQFSKLTKYICEEKKNVEERVLESWTTNLGEEEDVEVASWKIDAKHKAKTELREKGKDMTYHMIVSFTDEESEKLTNDDYKQISKKVNEALGLGSHEAVSAIHGDTLNKHMHIAVSLLDEQGRYKEPFKAYKTFQRVREDLAQEYGFDLSKSERGAEIDDVSSKMATHNNLESFSSWVKSNVKDSLKEHLESGKASWPTVHTLMRKNGIQIRKRGNGLVFSHTKEKLFVKSSSIDRGFSFGKLQVLLGDWEESKSTEKPMNSYKKNSYQAAKDLYKSYQKKLVKLRKLRKIDRDDSNSIFKADKALISKEIRDAKQSIMSSDLPQKKRTAKLKVLTFERVQRMEGVLEAHQKRLKKVKEERRHITWNDYLIEEAKKGDLQAIEALQAKGIGWKNTDKNQVYNDKYKLVGDTLRGLSCNVMATGEVVYKTKEKAVIRDRGMRLIVGDVFDDKKLEATLKLAVAKYGKVLHLNGDEAFKEAMYNKAKEMGLGVKFVDKAKTFKPKARGQER